MLRKAYRLRKPQEFQEVYQNKKSVATKNVVLFMKEKDKPGLQVGFSVSKKIGKAHVRNRCKRRMREIIRQNLDQITENYALIFLARKPMAEVSYAQLQKDMLYLLKKSGVRHD